MILHAAFLTRDQSRIKREFYSNFDIIFLQESELQILKTIKMRLIYRGRIVVNPGEENDWLGKGMRVLLGGGIKMFYILIWV